MIDYITLFGPTASGKSALAVALAESLNGEIINADSRQVYKDIPLITACPSQEDYTAVSHHLFEFMDVSEKYSAGRYAQEAAGKVAEVQSRGRLPIVVGGTGFYLKSLMLEGSAAAPEVSLAVAQTLKNRLETSGLDALMAELRALDPVAAQSIDAANPQRVLRALGVCLTTGQPFSSFKSTGQQTAKVLCLALNPPPEELNARIEQRWRQMQDAGVVEEVKKIRESEERGAPGLQSVGVPQIGAFLDGKLTWGEAESQYLAAMRDYAKRQRTWLRNQYPAAITWETPHDLKAMVAEVKVALKA